jgi:type I restriction enzyme R subunit
MRNDVIKKSFQEKMGLKERRSKLEMIKNKIMTLVDKFTW